MDPDPVKATIDFSTVVDEFAQEHRVAWPDFSDKTCPPFVEEARVSTTKLYPYLVYTASAHIQPRAPSKAPNEIITSRCDRVLQTSKAAAAVNSR